MKFKYWITVIITRYIRCINKRTTYHFLFYVYVECWTGWINRFVARKSSMLNGMFRLAHLNWFKNSFWRFGVWTVMFTVYDWTVSSVPEFHNTFLWIFANKHTSSKASEWILVMKWVNQHDMWGMEKYVFSPLNQEQRKT